MGKKGAIQSTPLDVEVEAKALHDVIEENTG